MHESFEQNFHQYVAVYLISIVRIWICENRDEKRILFHAEAKTEKRRRKTDTV